jgi:hypothetical protein
MASGDYNGDGRDDLAAFYSYPDSSATLFTFTATPTGGFNNGGVASWTTGPGNWYLNHFKLT